MVSYIMGKCKCKREFATNNINIISWSPHDIHIVVITKHKQESGESERENINPIIVIW